MARPTGWPGRRELLALLEEERQLIIRRFQDHEKIAEPIGPHHGVRWYLDIAKQWAIQHLTEMGTLPPGRLLDIGAYYGLIPGVAHRLGWSLAAVDVAPVPEYSSLRIPERKVEFAEYNACTDELPFPEESFDLVLVCEVLEHLLYSPMPMLREIHRVLRPGGAMFLSTPNPAGIGKLIRLARGLNPLEPHVDLMLAEGGTFTHKGLTFLSSNRESKLWTLGELDKAVSLAGMETVRAFRFGNTVPLELTPASQRYTVWISRTLFPILKRLPVGGGSNFVHARRPATAS